MKNWELPDRFAIIVGHSHLHQGANMQFEPNLSEYEYNKDLALLVYKFARDMGLDARIFLRDGLSIAQVGENVNEWCEDANACAIELHFDWFSVNKVQGTTTLYDMMPVESIDFARMVQKYVCKALLRSEKDNRGTRWVKMKDRGYYNLYTVDVPSCIIEPAFGSNLKDVNLLIDRRSEYAMSLAEVARDFLKKEREENHGKN